MCCPYPLLPSHQCLLSCDAILSTPICLDCVTLPSPVWEPWGASRHGQSTAKPTRNVGERKMEEGGAWLTDKERVSQGKHLGIWEKGRKGERE